MRPALSSIAPIACYHRQKLSYDGTHQLTQVQVEGIDGQGNVTRISQSNYVYDAMGRRLKKTVTDTEGKERITYYGWHRYLHISPDAQIIGGMLLISLHWSLACEGERIGW